MSGAASYSLAWVARKEVPIKLAVSGTRGCRPQSESAWARMASLSEAADKLSLQNGRLSFQLPFRPAFYLTTLGAVQIALVEATLEAPVHGPLRGKYTAITMP